MRDDRPYRFWRRVGVPVLLCLSLTFLAGRLFGPIGLISASAASTLALAWRFDNALGTCLPLAVLVLIVVAVLALLMVLLAVTHPG